MTLNNLIWLPHSVYGPRDIRRLTKLDGAIYFSENGPYMEFMYNINANPEHLEKLANTLHKKSVQRYFGEQSILEIGRDIFFRGVIRPWKMDTQAISCSLEAYLSHSNESHIIIKMDKGEISIMALTYSERFDEILTRDRPIQYSLEVQDNLRFVIRYLSFCKEFVPVLQESGYTPSLNHSFAVSNHVSV